jgi:hypothetical protein
MQCTCDKTFLDNLYFLKHTGELRIIILRRINGLEPLHHHHHLSR